MSIEALRSIVYFSTKGQNRKERTEIYLKDGYVFTEKSEELSDS